MYNVHVFDRLPRYTNDTNYCAQSSSSFNNLWINYTAYFDIGFSSNSAFFSNVSCCKNLTHKPFNGFGIIKTRQKLGRRKKYKQRSDLIRKEKNRFFCQINTFLGCSPVYAAKQILIYCILFCSDLSLVCMPLWLTIN